jgi:hypothetical protein
MDLITSIVSVLCVLIICVTWYLISHQAKKSYKHYYFHVWHK